MRKITPAATIDDILFPAPHDLQDDRDRATAGMAACDRALARIDEELAKAAVQNLAASIDPDDPALDNLPEFERGEVVTPEARI